jgi:DNA-binding MarR family transcriptional regulator
MPNEPTADDFRRLLKRRGVKFNTLHAALRVAYLDEQKRHYFRERDERIITFISMIGGIRAPDLRRIVGLTQPTLWRLVERLRLAGVLRVEHSYHDHIVGARARWIQPVGSVDLSDAQRAALIETAQLIRDYKPLWEME